MALTSTISGSSVYSYLVLPFLLLFINKRELLIGMLVASIILFYRIPPNIPISIIIILFYVISVFISGNLQEQKIHILNCIILTCVIIYIYISCNNSLTRSFSSFPFYVAVILFIFYAYKDKYLDLKFLNKILFISSIISVLFVFFILLLFPVFTDEGRRALTIDQNVNVLAHGISIALMIIFNKYLNTHKYMFFIVIAFIDIFFTGSRTAIIASLCSIFLIIYLRSNKKVILLKYIFGLGFVLFSLFYILANYSENSVLRYLDIFNVQVLNENTRLYTSEILFNEVIPYNWLWGIGLGNVNSREVLGYVPDADNMFVDILTQLGIVGATLVYSLFFMCIYKMYRLIKNHNNPTFKKVVLPFGLLIQEFVFSFGESVFDDIPFWLSIALCFIFLNSLRNERRTSNFDYSSKL